MRANKITGKIRCFLVLVLCFSTVYIASGQNTQKSSSFPNWHLLEPESGGFVIKFPAKPAYKLNSIKLANLEISTPTFSLLFGDSSYFTIAYYATFPGFDIDGGLTGVVTNNSNSITSKGGRVLAVNKIQLGACRGREIIGTTPQMGFSQTRVIISNEYFYLISYRSLFDTKPARDQGNYFLDSFKVSDECRGGVAPVEASMTEPKTSFIDGVVDPLTGWAKIASNENGFSLSMPSRAKLVEKQTKVKPYPLFSNLYTSASTSGAYTVEVIKDYPDGLYTNESLYEVVLDVTMNDFQKNLDTDNGKITLIKKLKLGTYPGREYSITTDSLKGRLQIFATPKKLYLIMATEDLKTNSSKDFERFFGSVRISVK